MPTFRYRAKTDSGEAVEGTIDAVTSDEAIEKISRQGYFPTSVEDVSAAPEESSPRLVYGRIRSRDVTEFSRQMSTLLKSGVPVLRALGVISEQSQSAAFKKILEEISTKMREGASMPSPNTSSEGCTYKSLKERYPSACRILPSRRPKITSIGRLRSQRRSGPRLRLAWPLSIWARFTEQGGKQIKPGSTSPRPFGPSSNARPKNT